MERKIVSGIMLTLLLVILVSTELNVSALTTFQGNLTIIGTVFWNNQTIVLNENLIIEEGGSLTLSNVTLIMNVTYDGQYHIEVKDGGEMYIYNSTITDGDWDDDNASWESLDNNRFWFSVRKGARFEMENSELHECGYTDEPWRIVKPGLYIETNDAIVVNNIISHNLWGIYLRFGESNMIIDNYITRNMFGLTLSKSNNNRITGNTVSSNSDTGISLYESHLNILKDNLIHNYANYGIHLYESEFNTLLNNTMHDGSFGIRSDHSNNNFIKQNNIHKTERGIELYTGSSNILAGNNVSNNYLRGILLAWSNSHILKYNVVSNNRGPHYWSGGIYVWGSNNILRGNTIHNNSPNGIYCRGSSNMIYHNNFIDNTIQALATSTNTWDDGYPSGGNYWSDYTGVDEFSGPYQNETGSDGIADTPYSIDDYNRDRYPLMNPVITATIDIYPDTLNLKSNVKWITCYIELTEAYNINDIDVESIKLTVAGGEFFVDSEAPTQIGDYDVDGIPDLMVKFDRAAVIAWLDTVDYDEDTGKSYEVIFVITGEVAATRFEGADTIRVLSKG